MEFKIATKSFDRTIGVPAEELHKVHYLFLHPEKRTILANGAMILGSDIVSCHPNYHKALGFNETYRLNEEDHAIIENTGLRRKAEKIEILASVVAKEADSNPSMLNAPLSSFIESHMPNLINSNKNNMIESLTEKLKIK